MAFVAELEKRLDEVFVKNAPALPEKGKANIVEYLPWINLILGLLALWAVYTLWHWAHTVNRLTDYVTSLGAAYGVNNVTQVNNLTAGVWLSLLVLAAQAALYLVAFPALKARRKRGWDLLFYAALVNVVYGLVIMFTDYGNVSSLVMSLLGSAIGLYFLFQIRSYYKGAKAVPEHAAKKA